jgi:hypothetical protein
MSAEVRLCLQCSGEIPKWKSKGTKFCNPGCKFKFEKQEKEKRRTADPRKTQGSILHQCLPNIVDVAIPCRCRKRVSDKEAKQFIEEGHVVNYGSRLPVFIEGRALLVVNKHLRFPRSATIERPHIQRATQDLFTIKGKVRVKDRSIEEMQKAIAQDRLERAEEESLRMNIYGWLTAEAWRALVVEVPAEEYDRAERESRGRCLFSFEDERSCAGIDVSPLSLIPCDRWDAEVEELIDKPEIETQAVEEEEPEREDGLTVVAAEEMEEVV